MINWACVYSRALVLVIVFVMVPGVEAKRKVGLLSKVRDFLKEGSNRPERCVELLGEPLEKHVVTKLSEIIKTDVSGKEVASSELALDFCNQLSDLPRFQYGGKSWDFVDGIVLRLGEEVFTKQDLKSLIAMQEFLDSNGEDMLALDLGLSATKMLANKATQMGLAEGPSVIEDLLALCRAQLKVSSDQDFRVQFRRNYGFSIEFLANHFRKRELALQLVKQLRHFGMPKKSELVQFLKDRNVPFKMKYDVKIALLGNIDLQLFQEKKAEPELVPFGFKEEEELDASVRSVLEKLEDGEISNPFFYRGEYWLVKRNGSEIIFIDGDLGYSQMHRELQLDRLKRGVSELQEIVGGPVAKTLQLDYKILQKGR